MNLLDQSAKLSNFFVNPNVILQIGPRGTAKCQKMIVFELPRRVGLLENLDGFFRPSARQHTLADGQRARAPLAQASDVSAAKFAEKIETEGISPR